MPDDWPTTLGSIICWSLTYEGTEHWSGAVLSWDEPLQGLVWWRAGFTETMTHEEMFALVGRDYTVVRGG